MQRFSRVGRIVGMLAVWLSHARTAAGQFAAPEHEKVRLVYAAPETCPGRDEFMQQIRARLGNDWEAPPGVLARTLNVTVSRTAERYLARIELRDARGKPVTRAVAGDDCRQVIEGIALVTVLAIQAQLEDSNGSDAPVSADESLAPTTPPARDETAPAAEHTPTKPKPRPPPPSRSSPFQVRLGGRGLVQEGVGPGLGTGVGAFAALAWPDFAFGLAVDVVSTGRVNADSVPADFNLLAARLDVSGRYPLLSSGVTVEPGIYFQAGRLEAQGDAAPPEVTRGDSGATAWLAPGALLAVRGELGAVLLGLEGSAGITLDREQFFVAKPGGKDVVYQVPWLTLSAALSLGIVF